MTIIRTLGPSLYSVFTAFIYAFILSAFYMAFTVAETLVKFGITETALPWYIVAVSFSTAIAMYSAVPKRPSLIRKNAAVILFITTLTILLCGMINLVAVKGQFGVLLYLSIYTLFLPMMLSVFLHIVCRNSNLDSVADYVERRGVEKENININTRASNNVNVISERDFVGRYYESYYREKFEEFDQEGTKVSWHWPAFFFSIFWFGYRKMWAHAFTFFFIIPTAISLLLYSVTYLLFWVLDTTIYLDGWITLLSYGTSFFVLAPLFANWLYFKHVRKSLRRKSFSEVFDRA